MNFLSAIVRGIDRLNEKVGRYVAWLTLILVLVTTYDVVMRYLFDITFVFIQELEWHLFAVLFLIAAGYTHLKGDHVRVDIVHARLSPLTKAWIELVFGILFLFPTCFLLIWTSIPFVLNAWAVLEGSPDPGGIPARYVLKSVIPDRLRAGGAARRFGDDQEPVHGAGKGVAGMMTDLLPALMFLVFSLLILAGYPIAFTIGGTALVFGLYGFGMDFFNLLPLRVWGIMTNFTLIAVTLFVFMGATLERSRLAEDLLETMGLVLGRLPGGLAISVVVVGTLLAASTGIVGATVTTMGLIALPTMLRRNYDQGLASGVICASGTLGQIIPPSIVLVLVGDILGVPVGDLFLGSLIPGVSLAAMYVIYLLGVSFFRPQAAPPIPPEERASISPRELLIRVSKVLVPPLFLMIAVLGSIFFGIAAPTEAAAMGASGALLLSIFSGRFSLKMLREVMETTTRLHHGRGVPAGVLPGLHRNRLHPPAGHRPHPQRHGLRSVVVRRPAGHQPANVLPHAALRLCPVLLPGRRTRHESPPARSTAASFSSSSSRSSG